MQTTTETRTALIDGMLQELEQEAQTTRRVLALVRDEHLGWRPHPRKRGRSASSRCTSRSCMVASRRSRPSPRLRRRSSSIPIRPRAAELIPTFDASIAKTRELLGGMDDATADGDVAVEEPATARSSRFLESRSCDRSC